MHVAFLVGSADISGGTNVIIEYASRLQRRNHQVTLITQVPVTEKQISWHTAAQEVDWVTLDQARSKHFDVLFATWWQSVFLLEQLNAANYLYFVQSIETRFFPDETGKDFETRDIDVLAGWCESTYGFPLPAITEARWIQKYLNDHYNNDAFLVLNGIRKDIYTLKGETVAPRRSEGLRVLVEGPLNVFFKNVEKTIELCRRADVDEIWLLTSSDISGYPGVDRCFSKIPIAETATVYRSCDVLVKLSYVEGMFGPPLEMFHCGGTAVVYDVTGHDEYITHEFNSLVVQRDDEQKVVQYLQRLKNEQGLLARLKEGAVETAKTWPDWEESTTALEQYLDSLVPRFSSVPSFLTEYSQASLEIRDHRFQERAVSRMIDREQEGIDLQDSFLNYIQLYYHFGDGFSNEKMLYKSYKSGEWVSCSISVPSDDAIPALRVDPSVRIGVVSVRSLCVKSGGSGKILAQWNDATSWDDVMVSGTARVLGKNPYPVLEAYGEDPQLILPALDALSGVDSIIVEIELREMSFAQALHSFCSPDSEQLTLKKRLMKKLFPFI